MKHLSNWIEIPVTDLTRAQRFYEGVLNVAMQPMKIGTVQFALFPTEDQFNCGALALGEGYQPSVHGVTVYLDGGKDMEGILQRVADQGGRVVLPKTNLGEPAGSIAFFLDSEGNRIGLQSME